MIRVEEVSFRHHRAPTLVVKNITFSVPNGSIAVLLGPNGSGKTTLFKCIAGLWKPCGGKVILDGKDTARLSFRERALRMALVPQDHTPPFPYTVLEAVLMGRAPHVGLYAAPSAADLRTAHTALEIVGVAHLAKRPYTRISGGERQLTLIARALAQEAPILLLDEPTSHLDFRNQHAVLSMVRRVAEQKRLTVLMTLHDPNLAAHFAHQVVLLKEGEITAQGTPEDVLTERHLKRLYGVGIGILSDPERRLFYPTSS
ncbi:MAG: ABC transporter ATP-binding protein [Geobacteraceae bacterium]|nr:ABC transporter ATP-binding protein [Geobacteraceae bacterium]